MESRICNDITKQEVRTNCKLQFNAHILIAECDKNNVVDLLNFENNIREIQHFIEVNDNFANNIMSVLHFISQLFEIMRLLIHFM